MTGYGQYGSSLRDLPRLRDTRRRRISSYDTTGGNGDRVTLQPGQTVEIANIEGAGSVNHIWMTVAPAGPSDPGTPDNAYLRKLVLRAYWDGNEHPSVARLLDDHDRADAWRGRFERSSAALDEACFRDGYYVQVPDPGLSLEHQWGLGCLSDQLIGQWWAHELGLGHLLPAKHVREALRSIVRHNLREAGGHGQRPYAVAGEHGLVMCTWPMGGRPESPTWYCDEVWTGSEYQVAAHCLREGLEDEATAILDAMWARHDGTKRNPFNEVECGDHYARAMAGWSVLEAALGLSWDHLTGTLRLGVEGSLPLFTGSGWGIVEWNGDAVSVNARQGVLPVRRVEAGSREYLVGEEPS